MVRKVLVGVALLFIVFLVVGFILQRKIAFTKSVYIIAPTKYVFEELNEIERWENWSYPQVTNPARELNLSSRTSGLDANYTWESDGGGKVIITDSRADTLLTAQIQLPSDTLNVSYQLKQKGDSVVLKANFRRKNVGSFFEGWKALLLTVPYHEKAVGIELQKIKNLAEGKPIFSETITEESLAPTYYIHLDKKIKRKNKKEMVKEISRMQDELRVALNKSNAERLAPAFCIYPNLQEEPTEVECAFTISPDARFPKEYPVQQHYSGAAIRGIHHGGLSTLHDTHQEILRYIRYKNLEKNGPPWEVYLYDLKNGKDSTKWITEIYYPVK